jgi:hypothetical protein
MIFEFDFLGELLDDFPPLYVDGASVLSVTKSSSFVSGCHEEQWGSLNVLEHILAQVQFSEYFIGRILAHVLTGSSMSFQVAPTIEPQ